ncbi:MAG: HNH endonuclease signature motif containing protein [Cutibacterium avidum]|nr:HNH endonuclease signature motif containing protein [Cutibacterium avidum]
MSPATLLNQLVSVVAAGPPAWLGPAVIVISALIVTAATIDIVSRHRHRDLQRLFTSTQKQIIRDRAHGRCEHVLLGHRCRRADTQADHILPWSCGGRTELDNAQLLCRRHNIAKSNTWPSPGYHTRLTRRRTHDHP